METKDYEPDYLDEVDVRAKNFEIIKTLKNLPIEQALHILDSTKQLILDLDCHTVDLSNDLLIQSFSEHCEDYF